MSQKRNPAVQPPAPNAAAPNRSGLRRKARQPAPGTKVLVIDRSGRLLRSLKDHPDAGSFQFLSAHDGRLALELARAELPDLVVTETDVAGMNGIELCQAIRQSAWVDRTPVVLVANSVDHETLARATQAGADFCLARPVDTNRLVGLITALTK